MPLYIKKDLETLMTVSKNRASSVLLPDGTSMSTTPGSVARLLLAVVNSEFESYYSKLEEVHLQSFLSTATGEYLDLISILFNFERNGMTDDEFRYAISKRVTTLEHCNELAISMALLAVDGVQDVKLRPFTHGTGSYTAFIITDTPEPTASVLEACRAILGEETAYGNKYEVEGPDLIPVEVGVKLIIKNTSSSADKIKESAKEAIKEYINSRKIGSEIIINEIIERVMAISEDIYDIEFFEFKVNKRNALIANQSCRYHERFIESSAPGSIKVY